MLTVILGAPGSGKSTVARRLRDELGEWAVIDWDDFMPSVGALTGRDVRTSPELWEPYRRLVAEIAGSLAQVRVLVLGVCTPDEMPEWSDASWLVLDCDEPERRHRLATRGVDEIEEAVADAAKYRALGLPTIDTTGRSIDEVVRDITTALGHRVVRRRRGGP